MREERRERRERRGEERERRAQEKERQRRAEDRTERRERRESERERGALAAGGLEAARLEHLHAHVLEPARKRPAPVHGMPNRSSASPWNAPPLVSQSTECAT
eukprot:1880805-Rhodomonas_salina.1